MFFVFYMFVFVSAMTLLVMWYVAVDTAGMMFSEWQSLSLWVFPLLVTAGVAYANYHEAIAVGNAKADAAQQISVLQDLVKTLTNNLKAAEAKSETTDSDSADDVLSMFR